MWKNRISVVLCIILTFTKFGLSVKLNHRRLISQRNSTTSQGYAKDGKPFQDDYYDYYYDDYYDYYDENDYGFDEFFCEENYDYDRVEYFEGDGYATMFPFPGDCTRAILCFGDRLEVRPCPDGLYFDIFDGVCDERDLVTCWEDTYPDYPEYPDDDERCPPADSNEVVFIPSEYCDSYYICIGGQPVLMNCPNGLHWNKDDNRCEDPRTAGCKKGPGPLPDCRIGITEQMPHPHNCNWFIHCEGNGSRSVQQCQHLFHFDVITNRCVFHTNARCIKTYGKVGKT